MPTANEIEPDRQDAQWGKTDWDKNTSNGKVVEVGLEVRKLVGRSGGFFRTNNGTWIHASGGTSGSAVGVETEKV